MRTTSRNLSSPTVVQGAAEAMAAKRKRRERANNMPASRSSSFIKSHYAQSNGNRCFSGAAAGTLMVTFICIAAVCTLQSTETLGSFLKSSEDDTPSITSPMLLSSALRPKEQSHRRIRGGLENLIIHDSFDGVDFWWQKPYSARVDSTQKITGILFVAHGCKHSGTDWWPYSNDLCPHCLGLPEELAIVHMARDRGMVVVSASSDNRYDKCWHKYPDGKRIVKVLDRLVEQEQFSKDIPIFALGSSSGAKFAGSILPDAMRDSDTGNTRLAGYICQNTSPSDSFDKEIPAVFISMPKDTSGAKAAESFLATSRLGAPSKQIVLPQIIIEPTFFFNRIPTQITMEMSEEIVEGLAKAEVINDEGELQGNPKVTRDFWRSVISPILIASSNKNVHYIKDSLEPDESPVFEVLNVAYGHHQTTRDGVAEALDWLLQQTHSSYASDK